MKAQIAVGVISSPSTLKVDRAGQVTLVSFAHFLVPIVVLVISVKASPGPSPVGVTSPHPSTLTTNLNIFNSETFGMEYISEKND